MNDFFGDNIAVTVILGIVAAILGFVAAKLVNFSRKADDFIKANLTIAQQEILHKLAAEAVAYAGRLYKDMDGETRLNKAIDYITLHLPAWIPVTSEMIRGVIEKVYLESKEKLNK